MTKQIFKVVTVDILEGLVFFLTLHFCLKQ